MKTNKEKVFVGKFVKLESLKEVPDINSEDCQIKEDSCPSDDDCPWDYDACDSSEY